MAARRGRVSDRDLLRRYLNDPASPDGREAHELLEYRKYRAVARHNGWLVWLTLVLAVTSALNLVAAFGSVRSEAAINPGRLSGVGSSATSSTSCP